MSFRKLLMVGLVSALSLALMQGCGGGASGGGKDGGTGGGTGSTGGGTGSTGGGTGSTGGGTGSTGGGTGSTGGGTGSTGGGTGSSGGCTTLPSVGPNIAGGAYIKFLRDGGVAQYQNWEGDVYIPHSDGGVDLMFVERWWDSTGAMPVFPTLGVSIPSDNKVNECLDCVYYLEGCKPDLSQCGKMYFATGGTLNYLTGTADPNAGVFSGNGSSIHLDEWNCAGFIGAGSGCADTKVNGGSCINVTSFQWDAGWP